MNIHKIFCARRRAAEVLQQRLLIFSVLRTNVDSLGTFLNEWCGGHCNNPFCWNLFIRHSFCSSFLSGSVVRHLICLSSESICSYISVRCSKLCCWNRPEQRPGYSVWQSWGVCEHLLRGDLEWLHYLCIPCRFLLTSRRYNFQRCALSKICLAAKHHT